MSLKSRTYEYVHDLETKDARSGYVLKTANARELISHLPCPQNVERNYTHVPDIPIDFLLSTTGHLPEHIAKQIENSENRRKFTNRSLLGLCTSGRGMPVEIFLHDFAMGTRDPSGGLFEEVIWHETVHGIEGIEIDNEGVYQRYMPWSYKLQQTMQSIDLENDHEPDLPDEARARSYIKYLRDGTSLQDNVSEVFARLAVIFMYEIKDTGKALASAQDLYDVFSRHDNLTRRSRKEINMLDSLRALETFSDEAQQLFLKENDTLVRRIAMLYGCDIRAAQ